MARPITQRDRPSVSSSSTFVPFVSLWCIVSHPTTCRTIAMPANSAPTDRITEPAI